MARQIKKASYRTNFVITCFWVPIVLFSSYQIISRSEQNEIIHETELKHPNTTNSASTKYISYTDKDVVNANINDEDKDEDNDDDVDVASRIRKTDVFHFCGDSRVQVMDTYADNDNDADDDMIPDTDETSIPLLYQCSGEPYEQFADILHSFAYNRSITSSSNEKKKDNDEDGNYKYNNSSPAHNKNTVYWKRKEEGDQCSAFVPSNDNNNILWGKREFPIDDNMTILAIGNSHLRQISKTIACQYAHKLKSIHFLPSIRDNTANTTGDDGNNDNNNNNNIIESFFLEFSNNARWISVTNQVVLYSEEWKELLEEFYLNSLHPSLSSSSSATSQRSTGRGAGLLLEDIDAIIFGKFTTYKQAKGTNFERTMNDEEQSYNDYRNRHDTTQQQQQQQEESNHSKRILLRKKGGNEGTRTTTNALTTVILNSNNNTSTTTTNTSKVADPVTRQTTALTPTPIINFESILPPDIVDIARIYNGPIISISMFSKSYTLDAQSSYDTYRQQCLLLAENKEEDSNNTTAISSRIDNDDAAVGNINKNLYLIDSRRYIIEMGIECGTDDKKTIGTCHEPPSIKSLEDRGNQTTITNSTSIQRYRDSSDMHRCAGARGGHTDLVAWDVIESLYDTKKLHNA
jgi:hypothetical protein